MTDYTAQGAAPVDDTDAEDPPTVDEVARSQRDQFPGQARSRHPITAEETAAVDAGGEITDVESDGEIGVEGPNPT